MYHLLKRLRHAAIIWIIVCVCHADGKCETNETTFTLITNKVVSVGVETNFDGSLETNGLACELWVGNHPPYVGQITPVCIVSVTNASLSDIISWTAYPTNYLKINLFDSAGQLVDRTANGKQYGKQLDEKQLVNIIKKRDEEHRAGKFRTDGFIRLLPLQDRRFSSFGIPELFNLEQSGEYTLKVQMSLIERASGFASNPKLKILPLPEVVARIQIHVEDIVTTNLTRNSSINSTTK